MEGWRRRRGRGYGRSEHNVVRPFLVIAVSVVMEVIPAQKVAKPVVPSQDWRALRGTAKPKFKLLGQNRIESDETAFDATPAVSGARLFLRSRKRLYCVE